MDLRIKTPAKTVTAKYDREFPAGGILLAEYSSKFHNDYSTICTLGFDEQSCKMVLMINLDNLKATHTELRFMKNDELNSAWIRDPEAHVEPKIIL